MGNNPINFRDYDGRFFGEGPIIGGMIGGFSGFFAFLGEYSSSELVSYLAGTEAPSRTEIEGMFFKDVIIGAGVGAVVGAIVDPDVTAPAIYAAYASGALTGAAVGTYDSLNRKKKQDPSPETTCPKSPKGPPAWQGPLQPWQSAPVT